MKQFVTHLLIQVLIFIWLSSGQAQEPAGADREKPQKGTPENPAITNPVEKDPRVQSDGKGWRVERAKISDPNRPRVLLIGDSILNGYLNRTVKLLDGKVYVDAWVNPYCQSEGFNKLLDEVLEKNGPYDVVHINLGLHGFQKDKKMPDGTLGPRIKEGTYQPLTEGFIAVIRNRCPKAHVIWANTTPIRIKDKIGELDTELNAIIIEHNRLAAEVMAKNKIPINDFYSLLINKLELARPDSFHWTDPANKILAEACAKLVLQELTEASR